MNPQDKELSDELTQEFSYRSSCIFCLEDEVYTPFVCETYKRHICVNCWFDRAHCIGDGICTDSTACMRNEYQREEIDYYTDPPEDWNDYIYEDLGSLDDYLTSDNVDLEILADHLLDELDSLGINNDWRKDFEKHEFLKNKINPELWKYYDNIIRRDKLHWEETLESLSKHYNISVDWIINLLNFPTQLMC